MAILIPAVILVLSAQEALAERRENKPFHTVNGRTSIAAPAAAVRAAAAISAAAAVKPGALIRTAGQLPRYEEAGGVRTHSTNAGEIALNSRKARDAGRAPGIRQGPKDTPPPPNPGAFGRSYAGGASPNADIGRDNNGSGNNGKTAGDDHDAKGGAGQNSFDDPTGFNDAY
ncbi:MAG: hypothetical protein HY403_11870 [Elusimicrobia bacterium]|nr:hypothetical protein [Elusimicrobiota bacterium]